MLSHVMARALKWEDIAERLAQAIADGTYRPGALLPSVRAIEAAEGVSRVTALHALTHLVEAGTVVAEHGVGYRVTRVPAPVDQSLVERVAELERVVADHERRLPPQS